MADVKISALPAASTPLDGTELVPIVQGGVTEQVTVANLTAGRTVAAGTVNVDANTSSNAVRITQTGTGNAILVEDSANPDATPFVVDAGGNVLIGTTVNPGIAGLALSGLGNPSAQIDYYETGTGGAALRGRKARGTQAAPAAVAADDYIVTLLAAGFNGTSFTGNAGLAGFRAAETFAVGAQGTNFVVETTANGTISRSERMRITAAGNVGIGTSAPGALLNVVANTSTDAVRITQTGTGNALVVEDAANPDATPFVINADGSVVRGATSPVNIRGVSHGFQVVGPTFNNASELFLRFSNDASPSGVEFAKTRSATASGNAIVASGDNVGQLIFSADDGTQYLQAATITAAVDGTPGANDMPGRLVFSTTADGASSPTERMRITAAGNVVAGGSVALATTATDGFLYVPTCAGIPTGTPTTITGMAPIVVNTTNNKLYFYSGGAWRDAGP